MARKKAPKEEEPALDMSSLIDVSFLLLIYFIVTSTLEKAEGDLAMTMPTNSSDSAAAEVEPNQLEIEVSSEGVITANEEVLDQDPDQRDLPLLTDRLRTYKATVDSVGEDPLVVIKASDGAKGQRFVDVLNALADDDVKITSVTMSGFVE